MIEGFFTNWIILVGIFGLALISPGPDFVIAVRNSISFSKKAGLFTAAGFALGVGVHVTYTLFGLAAIIAQSVLLFTVIKYVGAIYLIYIGVQALKSKGFNEEDILSQKRKKHMSDMDCFWNGFLTNLLNPKATLFFLSIFSQFIQADTGFEVKALYGATCIIMTALWFSLVAIFLNQKKIKEYFLKAAKWIDRICGGFLIGLGIKLALTNMAVKEP